MDGCSVIAPVPVSAWGCRLLAKADVPEETKFREYLEDRAVCVMLDEDPMALHKLQRRWSLAVVSPAMFRTGHHGRLWVQLCFWEWPLEN